MTSRAFIVAFAIAMGICACSGSPGAPSILRASNANTSDTPTPSPSPNPSATVLLDFSSQNVGSYPNSDLKLIDGKFYGTTNGVTNSVCICGNVYAVTPTGATTLLHAFVGGNDGSHPSSDLAYDKGKFYGLTMNGGGSSGCGSSRSRPDGCGTIYSITPSGTEHVLYAFTVYTGYYPAGLPAYSNGKLYGLTQYGATNNTGMIWSFDIATKKLKTIYTFSSQQADAIGGVTLVGSTLYGAIAGYYNGTQCETYGRDCGWLFSIKTDGSDFKVLHAFKGTDGATPQSALAKVGDFFYGATAFGGRGCTTTGGCGTLFSIDTAGRFKTLVRFSGDGSQGANPVGTVFAGNGVLYGATEYGGQTQCESYRSGCGAIYAFQLGSKKLRVVYSFNGAVGAQPLAGVTLDGPALYGTTYYGGPTQDGTLYRYQISH